MPRKTNSSPHWSPTTKLLVGLVIVSIGAFLLFRFANLITPLLMIFIITYLLHPVTALLAQKFRISWKLSVNIIYLLILITLIGLLTWGGFGLAGQTQSLVHSVQNLFTDLPTYIADLSTRTFTIGGYTIDMHKYDINDLSNRLLAYMEPLLGQTGNLLGALAGSAAETIGWTLFVLTVSYFVMSESSGLREELFMIDIPGYKEDIRIMVDELSRTWNAFLRGQIIIFFQALVIYSILLPAMGVRYALGIAFLAGLAKFLPYVGPAITWGIMALVTFFQGSNPFDISPFAYMLIVVVTTSIIDWVMDNFISPRIMSRALKVHPAAVLIAAIIAANLLGLLGVVIAAPFLATVLLVGRYIMRKMFDLDPWPPMEREPDPPGIRESFRIFIRSTQNRFAPKTETQTISTKEKQNESSKRTKN